MELKINQLKAGVILSYISRSITILVGILYTPVMIRLLGQNEYGLYNIAASTIAYLGILNFGFGSAYMRFYSRYKVREDSEKIAVLNSMFLTIFSLLGVLAVVFGVWLAFNVDVIFGLSLSAQDLQITQKLFFVLVFNLSVSFPAIVFNTYLQANEQFVFQNVVFILSQLTSPLISLPVLLAGYGSIGMVTVTVLVNILTEGINMYYCIRKMDMRFSFKEFDRALLAEMTLFSFFIFINMVVDQVNNNVDKTILGRFKGTVPVAIYSIGANLNLFYQQVSVTVANVFTPRIHRMIAADASDSELTGLFTRIGRVQFILLTLVVSGFLFFGRPFIGIWAGADYYSSFPIALVLMLAGSVPLIQNVGIEIQRAKNMHQFRSWIYLFIALGNVLLSIPLAQKYGAFGSAVGTAIAVILGNVFIMNWYYHKKVGIDIKYFWQQIANFSPALIPPLILGIGITRWADLYSITHLLFYGFLYVAVFSASAWLIGMNDYEKHLVKNPFK